MLKEEDAAVRSLRLELSAVTARTIKAAMSLLGIKVPERM
ncbi:DALR anticodon-binding domain-containing protein [Pseudoneobacillus sp. C159]